MGSCGGTVGARAVVTGPVNDSVLLTATLHKFDLSCYSERVSYKPVARLPLLLCRCRAWDRAVRRMPRAIFLLMLLVAVGGWTCSAENWALVIGISTYADPAIVPLSFAATDARQVGRTFVEHGCVPEGNLTVLLNEAATKEAVLAALDQIGQTVGSSDTVFLYIAGHGATTPDLDGDEADGDRQDEALLVYDSFASDPETFLLDDALGDWMSTVRAGSVAVFFDACHSGGQSRSLDPAGSLTDLSFTTLSNTSSAPESSDTMARDLITSVTQTSRGILAACGSQEMAYESRGLGHGVFTHFLIDAMSRQATDLDGDGAVFLDELASVVIDSVVAWSRMRNETQTPVLEQAITQEILIIPSSPESASTLVAPLDDAGLAPLEGFVGVTEAAPIPLEIDTSGHAQRFRFPPCSENDIEEQVVPGGIAQLEDRWITADPVSGYVYAVSEDGSAHVLARMTEPVNDFAIQSGVLYASYSLEDNALTTYDLHEGFALRSVRLNDTLPFDRAELTGVAVDGSILSLVGWSGGVETLVVYDLHRDSLMIAAPIAGSGSIGLQAYDNALYRLDARHGFLVRLEKYDDQPEIAVTFVTDLNSRVPGDWLPYDPRGEHENLTGFYFTDTHLLLSTRVSEGIEQAELFTIDLAVPLVGSSIPLMSEPDALAPMEMPSP